MLPLTSVLRRLATRRGGSHLGSSSSPAVVMMATVAAAPPKTFQADAVPKSPTSRSLSAAAAAASTATNKKTKKGGSDGNESSSSSYFARKAAAKEQRRATYQHKISMNDKRRGRRNGTQHQLKPNFHQWFDAVKAHDERLERKARQLQSTISSSSSSNNNNNKVWKIQVACIVERLPVVMPDKPSWLQDFTELQEYEQQFGKQYPPEFVGHNNADTYLKDVCSGDDMKPPTDEELMGTLFLFLFLFSK